jgi:hypothetical protein
LDLPWVRNYSKQTKTKITKAKNKTSQLCNSVNFFRFPFFCLYFPFFCLCLFSLDLEIRRHRFATAELRMQANTHHKETKSKTKKNVKKDDLHQELGNIRILNSFISFPSLFLFSIYIPSLYFLFWQVKDVGSQNLNEIDQKRPKALRDRKQKATGDAAGENGNRKKVKKNEDM